MVATSASASAGGCTTTFAGMAIAGATTAGLPRLNDVYIETDYFVVVKPDLVVKYNNIIAFATAFPGAFATEASDYAMAVAAAAPTVAANIKDNEVAAVYYYVDNC